MFLVKLFNKGNIEAHTSLMELRFEQQHSIWVPILLTTFGHEFYGNCPANTSLFMNWLVRQRCPTSFLCCSKYQYRISSNKRQAWNKLLPLISASPLIITTALNVTLIRIVTIFYWKLNQNAYGRSMQTIKQWKYCWYLDFSIILGLLTVKIYLLFLFWKKNWPGFHIYYCSFP